MSKPESAGWWITGMLGRAFPVDLARCHSVARPFSCSGLSSTAVQNKGERIRRLMSRANLMVDGDAAAGFDVVDD